MRDETNVAAAVPPGHDGAASAPDANEAAAAGGRIPGGVLADLWERGRAAFPDLALDVAALSRYLDARAPPDADLAAWLGALRAADVYLASACVEGIPGALRAFEAAYLTQVDSYLRSLRPTAELVADTKQMLLVKLFVAEGGRPPKVHQYSGRGSLQGWVRVVALSTALDLVSSEKTARPREHHAGEIARCMAPASTPDAELMKAAYGGEFLAALRDAIVSLSPATGTSSASPSSST
jgi:RNA polymerase sigma-70 factor (ECF subfamily)